METQMQNETENLDYYTSSDLGCCSSLLASGFKLLGIEKSDPRRAFFCFERSAALEQAVNDYWSDNMQVNARDLVDSIKKLKERIYGE